MKEKWQNVQKFPVPGTVFAFSYKIHLHFLRDISAQNRKFPRFTPEGGVKSFMFPIYLLIYLLKKKGYELKIFLSDKCVPKPGGFWFPGGFSQRFL
jgi:hypothetical protein